ncbi:SSI family serine proteinase inhibitor [Nonomuraea dietziae]|uniref:SSI family serine proteinase inhibitor n=1 Tax=Nonomuraea dietziae TaxID=65515 RepID=UPI00342ED4C7
MTSIKIVGLVAAAVLCSSAATCPTTTANLWVAVTAGQGAPATARLTCGWDGGTHPKAAAACALLTTVEGDLARHPGERGACTKEHHPHTVSLSGTWNGRNVSYLRTFGNRCVMLLATGAVFDL